ncbi:hypothetical protein GA0116948_1382 [Chitinophaga costaii]|uniref:Uncharacterized protein n=1 Tax=Chitinophaga costaii TaxID=1335309 RepID=A0A1C4G9G9_9BACT|nr:hypothetical protein [Chitinophaga costaii]PUZ19172.1 hypothetical protein DCM91_20860 [Chitinophaga costaii]SCC64837.1 hypothetical protein GA0116948_1382 [Chitinophaga costaii]
MKEYNKLEILCLYCSYAGRVTSYYELCNDADFMEKEEYTNSGFLASLGGFSITIRGFNTIFNSYGFYNVMKATTFLLNTLYWLEGKYYEDWFNDYSNTDLLSIEFGINEILTIRKNGMAEIQLSYFNKEKMDQSKRGEHFFYDFVLRTDEWLEACRIALEEYFAMLLKVVRQNKHDDAAIVLLRYQEVWRQIK